MRSSIIAALSFVAAAFAISITSPVDGATWSIDGPNTVTWTSVSSDPTAFRIVLVNPSYSVKQELSANTLTSLNSVVVQAPSGGFPVGTNWQINLYGLASANPDAILAQSGKFTISDAASTGTTNIPTTMPGATLTAVPTVATGAASGDSTGSDQLLSPTGTPNAASSKFATSGFLVAVVGGLYAAMLF